MYIESMVPVAYSMVALDRQQSSAMQVHPYQRFMCYWTAFNNIYVMGADLTGMVARYVQDRNGQPAIDNNYGYQMRRVRTPSERDQITAICQEIDERGRHDLIVHPSTKFFAERIPLWRGRPITNDSNGNKLNGVLNLTRTLRADHPYWSPINTEAYNRYLGGDMTDSGTLAEQIIMLLYTVRNNLFHGAKLANGENDVKVVQEAIPLLNIVVNSFLYQER